MYVDRALPPGQARWQTFHRVHLAKLTRLVRRWTMTWIAGLDGARTSLAGSSMYQQGRQTRWVRSNAQCAQRFSLQCQISIYARVHGIPLLATTSEFIIIAVPPASSQRRYGIRMPRPRSTFSEVQSQASLGWRSGRTRHSTYTARHRTCFVGNGSDGP